jgi:50S ribosomal protein uL3
MTLGLVGRKRGMSRIYTDDGRAVAVTVIEVEPNRVVRLKNEATDGYTAVEVVVGAVRPERLAKPQVGHFAKAGVEPGPLLLEWRVDPEELERYPVGSTIPLTHLPVGRTVDVRGRTRGKGFAGTIKRHHFASQDATHGNSLSHQPGLRVARCAVLSSFATLCGAGVSYQLTINSELASSNKLLGISSGVSKNQKTASVSLQVGAVKCLE